MRFKIHVGDSRPICPFSSLLLYILGLSKENVFADTETDSDDDSFAGYKKKGHKITFSDNDDDDDFSLSLKPSTSKGLKGSNDSKCSKGKICSTFTVNFLVFTF